MQMPADPWSTPASFDRSATAEASFIAKVYRWMAGGLALTGIVAWVVANDPRMLQAIYGNPAIIWVLFIVQLIMVVAFTSVVRRASFGTAAAMFLAYCALTGVTFSFIFLAYTRESIASTFFITGGAFAAMSAYGTLTKKDLTSWGQFLFMGLIGIIIAGIVNIFMRSDALNFVVSCVGVVVFTGLTAYDAQKIKALAQVGDDRLALHGALALYLDFINLFLMLLRLFGRRSR
jgi:FtsH-binding integral membrane protein